MPGETRQRLDKWIWFARVVRSREAAAGLVQQGHVRVNRVRIVKPGYDVSPGDVLTIVLNGRVRVMEVLRLAERRGSASDAELLYRDTAMPEGDGTADKNGGASGPRTC